MIFFMQKFPVVVSGGQALGWTQADGARLVGGVALVESSEPKLKCKTLIYDSSSLHEYQMSLKWNETKASPTPSIKPHKACSTPAPNLQTRPSPTCTTH
jgi:hypothetical protein